MVILDMEMPKSCKDCRLKYDNQCIPLRKSCLLKICEEEKLSNCPIKAEIPTGATNGDVLLALYPHEDLLIGSEEFGTDHNEIGGMRVLKEWWNAPYRREE